VTGIQGDYLNVVGFPMHRFCAELDVAHLAEWSRTQLEIGAWESRAEPNEQSDEPAEVTDAVVAAVSSKCPDDECGLPSDYVVFPLRKVRPTGQSDSILIQSRVLEKWSILWCVLCFVGL